MMICLFSYELRSDPLRNIDPLLNELRSFPGWCSCLDKTWLIATYDTDINMINQRLARHLRTTDYWLLIRIMPQYQGWLPQESWQWLENTTKEQQEGYLKVTATNEVWMTTFTGVKFNPLNPDPQLINIDDIAHGLSLTCRYSGQCKEFYSVAEHSIRLSELVKPNLALAALLHDASEAYLTDVPSLVKQAINGYVDIEDRLLRMIFAKYGVDYLLLHEFEREENILFAAECRDLVTNTEGFYLPERAMDEWIVPWKPWIAEEGFKARFNTLVARRKK